MTSPRDGLDSLIAEFNNQRNQLVESQKKIHAITATVSSVRNELTVTVGHTGEIQTLRFNNRDYRNLGPEALAELVTTTITQAREQVAEAVQAAMRPMLGDDSSLQGMLTGEVDWQEMFPAGLFDQIDSRGPVPGEKK